MNDCVKSIISIFLLNDCQIVESNVMNNWQLIEQTKQCHCSVNLGVVSYKAKESVSEILIYFSSRHYDRTYFLVQEFFFTKPTISVQAWRMPQLQRYGQTVFPRFVSRKILYQM